MVCGRLTCFHGWIGMDARVRVWRSPSRRGCATMDNGELRVLQMSLVDEVVRVSTPDAMSAARCAALSHGMLVRPRVLPAGCDGRN